MTYHPGVCWNSLNIRHFSLILFFYRTQVKSVKQILKHLPHWVCSLNAQISTNSVVILFAAQIPHQTTYEYAFSWAKARTTCQTTQNTFKNRQLLGTCHDNRIPCVTLWCSREWMNEWVVEIHWHTEVHKQSYHSVKNIYSTCSGLLITIIIYLGDMEMTLKSKVDYSITDCWHLYWWTCTQISSTNSYQLKVMNSLWSEWWNILGISIMATLNRWHWLRKDYSIRICRWDDSIHSVSHASLNQYSLVIHYAGFPNLIAFCIF